MNTGSYAFVYDEALSDRRYERDIAALETKLTTLGLTGRDVRLAMFRSVKETIIGLVRQGVSTVVVVGNDRTLDKVMWFLPDLDVTLGYLPVFSPSDVAAPLGIPAGLGACDVLAARRIETVDVGICQDRYFLTEAKVANTIAAVRMEGKYSLSPINGGTIVVRNLDIRSGQGEIRNDAKDGLLEVIIKPNAIESNSRWRRPKPEITKLYMKSGEIISQEPIDLLIDGHVTNGFQFTFGIVPKKLKIIVGRTRRLSPKDDVLPEATKSVTIPAAMGRK